MIFLNGSLGYAGMGEFLGLILIFILILALAYFVTKWLGKNGYNLQKNRNIKVVETYRLNQNTAIYIVKMANKTAVLGVSKDHVDYLTELDGDSVIMPDETTVGTTVMFRDILKKHQDKGKSKG